VSLISPWWSSFRIAFSAVYRSASVGFEGNFAFLSTVGTDCIVHLFSIHCPFQLLVLFNTKTAFCTLSLISHTVLNLFLHERRFQHRSCHNHARPCIWRTQLKNVQGVTFFLVVKVISIVETFLVSPIIKLHQKTTGEKLDTQ